MALVVSGKVVTFDENLGVLEDVSVYVADSETGRNATIEAVVPSGGGEPAGYQQAPRVRTEGVMYPGLIDLHNHLAYNYRSLWFAPGTEPYENLIRSSERNVRLVMVGGRPFYGNRSLMAEAGATDLEPIRVGGVERAISLIDPELPDADLTWTQVVGQIQEVLDQPSAAVERSLEAATRDLEPPLRLIPGMPGGEIARDVTAFRDIGPITMPPLDTLAHDRAFFERLAVERAPIVGGFLDGLRSYFD